MTSTLLAGCSALDDAGHDDDHHHHDEHRRHDHKPAFLGAGDDLRRDDAVR